MDYKLTKPLEYGTSKKNQDAIKKIMVGKKNLEKKDSQRRINKVQRDTIKDIRKSNSSISPTARLNQTFGKKEII
jgi:hypothetical protein